MIPGFIFLVSFINNINQGCHRSVNGQEKKLFKVREKTRKTDILKKVSKN